MLFKEPKVVRSVFKVDDQAKLKRNNTVKIEIETYDEPVVLEIFINTVDVLPDESRQINGYFLDGSQWYLVNLLKTTQEGKKHNIIMSPKDPPLLVRPELRDYFERRIKEIEEIGNNLA
ncbi:hypothetical protein J5491_01995 [Candidatus Saccharibacteria bacterium]|nr:hypothetical protein [Candidatus Saccharibacteria bacterium]